MKVTFFKTASDFRKWLEKNHAKKRELIVGYYKVGSGKPSMNWSESVDQALCFGWIDGIRRTIDEKSYCIRFTPRNPNSIWSGINIKNVTALKKQGLMHEAGLAVFKKKKEHKTKVYTFENEAMKLSKEFTKQLKADKEIWNYFQSLAPSYRKLSINWVMSAKQKQTQERRFGLLMKDCREKKNQWKNNKYNKKK